MNPPPETATSIVDLVLKGGVPAVLVLVCLFLAKLYNDERKENRKLNGQINELGRESIAALVKFEVIVSGQKEALNMILDYVRRRAGKED